MTEMKTIKLSALLGPLMLALPVYASFTTCIPTTLDQYILNSTVCQTGDLSFSNFQFTSSSPAVTAANIHVQPLVASGGFYFPFVTSISSNPDGSAATESFTVSYRITALNNTQIDSMGLDFNGGGFHLGTTTMTTGYCTGNPTPSCPTGQGGKTTLDPANMTGTLTFPTGSTTLFISMNANLDSGVQGSAFFNQMENSVVVSAASAVSPAATPEPGVAGLSSLGLAFLILRFRRKQN
jgi:hypothetical protein